MRHKILGTPGDDRLIIVRTYPETELENRWFSEYSPVESLYTTWMQQYDGSYRIVAVDQTPAEKKININNVPTVCFGEESQIALFPHVVNVIEELVFYNMEQSDDASGLRLRLAGAAEDIIDDILFDRGYTINLEKHLELGSEEYYIVSSNARLKLFFECNSEEGASVSLQGVTGYILEKFNGLDRPESNISTGMKEQIFHLLKLADADKTEQP